jgi:DUF4097 and DUF4098 domain-containing protein YvlB
MTMLAWNFSELSTDQFETSHHEVKEDFRSISIVTDTADMVLIASEDSKCEVVCHEQKNGKHSVSVRDGVLIIEVKDTRKWYEYVGIQFGTPKITVYIPAGEYGMLSVKSDTGDMEIPEDFIFKSIDIAEHTGDVTCYASALEGIKIKTSTGKIYLENVSADSLELSASTGNVSASNVICAGDVSVSVSTGKTVLTNITCKNVISNGSTGNISLNNVIAAEGFSIERSTGDVKLDCSDAMTIDIETDTGDVEGSVLTDKIFITKTDTGNVRVPSSRGGGRCEITTDTGDIKIDIAVRS